MDGEGQETHMGAAGAPPGFKNSKSLADIDQALRALSEAAGAGGESYRTAHGGRHRFDVGRSKTHPDPLEAWGPRIAEAAGCRVKVSGLSEDRTLVQGHLDADNWSLDPMGIAQPYADGSFEALPGSEHRPSSMPPAPPPRHAAAHAAAHSDENSDEDHSGEAHSGENSDEDRSGAQRPHDHGPDRIEGNAAPLDAARRASPHALALARALVDCGIDPDELMLALARAKLDARARSTDAPLAR